MKSLTRHLALIAFVGSTLAACDKQEQLDGPSTDPSLERISDCGGLKSYASQVALEMLLNNRYTNWRYYPLAEDAADGNSDGAGGASPTDYTGTNNQEEGVDELDIVKTDGNYIYTVQDRALHIVKSWPIADTEKVATVELDGWTNGLFLDGDTLYVFSYIYRDDGVNGQNPWLRNWTGTRISAFDISDRTAPTLTRTIDVEGWLADARFIDGNLYGVMNHWMYFDNGLWDLMNDPSLPEVDWTLEGDALDADIAAKREEARAILEPQVASWAAALPVDDLLPRYIDSASGVTEPQTLLECSDLYRPQQTAQYNVLSVVHLGDPDGELNAAGIVSDGWTLYASQDNLYVAQTSWWWWWGWGDQDMATHIHKFNLGADGVPAYQASGRIDGWLYDQFAMSEYDGHLRVTTTDVDWWWGWWGAESDTDAEAEEPGNNVFVLADDGAGVLDVVGEVRGIAPNEQIYATRMMGPKGYMVTFRQTDPLFTLDLSDPTAPAVVGELHVTGYSAYLHPMDDGHLLAVGQAGDEDGTITGLAISVFDVSDMANPTLVQSYTLEDDANTWSWSEALWDHHAFTWHRDVLTIPAYYYSWDEVSDDYDYFSGAISFSATPAGVSEIGRVDHRDLVEQSECLYNRWYDYGYDVCNEWAWYASVRRDVYIEDNLFSISDYGIKVTDLNDPTVEHARVLFYPNQP